MSSMSKWILGIAAVVVVLGAGGIVANKIGLLKGDMGGFFFFNMDQEDGKGKGSQEPLQMMEGFGALERNDLMENQKGEMIKEELRMKPQVADLNEVANYLKPELVKDFGPSRLGVGANIPFTLAWTEPSLNYTPEYSVRFFTGGIRSAYSGSIKSIYTSTAFTHIEYRHASVPIDVATKNRLDVEKRLFPKINQSSIKQIISGATKTLFVYNQGFAPEKESTRVYFLEIKDQATGQIKDWGNITWVENLEKKNPSTAGVIINRAELAKLSLDKAGIPIMTGSPIKLPCSDVSISDWYHDIFLTVYAYGIMSPIQGKCLPAKNVLRAEFAKIAVNAFALKPNYSPVPYKDVKKGDWFYNYVATLYRNLGTSPHLVGVYPDGGFHPGENTIKKVAENVLGYLNQKFRP